MSRFRHHQLLLGGAGFADGIGRVVTVGVTAAHQPRDRRQHLGGLVRRRADDLVGELIQDPVLAG